MALRKNLDTVNEQANLLGSLFDAGTLELYTGAQPADPNSGPSGSLLATIPIPNPAFGAAVAGAITKAGTWSVTASATGIAGWARMISADTNKSLDLTVSGTPGGNNLLISDENVVNGNLVSVDSLVITVPNGV